MQNAWVDYPPHIADKGMPTMTSHLRAREQCMYGSWELSRVLRCCAREQHMNGIQRKRIETRFRRVFRMVFKWGISTHVHSACNRSSKTAFRRRFIPRIYSTKKITLKYCSLKFYLTIAKNHTSFIINKLKSYKLSDSVRFCNSCHRFSLYCNWFGNFLS